MKEYYLINIDIIYYILYIIYCSQTEFIRPGLLVLGISFKYSSNFPSYFNFSKSSKYSLKTLNFKSNGYDGS